jgi:HSP90 family molecular chaperone
VSGEAAIADPSLPLEITITTDEEKGTLTLRDTGKKEGREGMRK